MIINRRWLKRLNFKLIFKITLLINHNASDSCFFVLKILKVLAGWSRDVFCRDVSREIHNFKWMKVAEHTTDCEALKTKASWG